MFGHFRYVDHCNKMVDKLTDRASSLRLFRIVVAASSTIQVQQNAPVGARIPLFKYNERRRRRRNPLIKYSATAAVENAVTMPWGNAQVEGQVNKLKALKRQMYGRGSTELLRTRLLPVLACITLHQTCATPR